MNQEEIQDFANENNLDVRPIQENHYRLMDEYGKYILDIYFKKNKKGRIIKNSTLQWKTNKWFTPLNFEELKILL